MKSVLVLGGGKVGKSTAEMLLACGRGAYRVTLADRDEANLREAEGNLKRLAGLTAHKAEFACKVVDAGKREAVREALKGHEYVVCMLPFNLVSVVAEEAAAQGAHYFDVTEDVRATDAVKALAAKGANSALMPQCGLAPGYIAVAAHAVAKEFDEVHDLMLRVGALPQYPTNALKYNVTWSTAGVVNEYCEPCNVMLDGKHAKVPALEGLEWFSFEGVEYEAFYTSGGVGSLIETLEQEKKVAPHTRVAYKTIRYPGHRDLMKFLLQDLRLGEKSPAPGKGERVYDRNLAIDLLDHAIPRAAQDLVVVFINCIGMKGGQRRQVNFRRSIRATSLFGRVWPAIELTTSAGVCAMVDLHRLGRLPAKGFIRQEDCDLALFNETLFGKAFEAPETLEAACLER